MVGYAADYPWSSYQFNGQGMASALLSQHPLNRARGRSTGERRRQCCESFREHLEAELNDEIRQTTNGNYVLGDSRFSAEVEAMLPRRVTPGKVGRPEKT